MCVIITIWHQLIHARHVAKMHTPWFSISPDDVGLVLRRRQNEANWSAVVSFCNGRIPESALTATARVTDASAQAVALAADTIGTPVSAVATGTRYEIHGDVDDDTMSILATRLLANQVIERWAVGPIEPTFVDVEATADTGVELVEIDNLDDEALLALNRERGLSLDIAELHAIAEHFRLAGRAPTDVELETLAQTWSEHCAHKTFRKHHR